MVEIELQCEKCGKEQTRSIGRDGSYIGARCCDIFMKQKKGEDNEKAL